MAHTGDTFGQHAVCLLAPAQGFALILLTNAQPGGSGGDAAVLAATGAAYLGITAPTDQAQLGLNGGSSYVADGTPLTLTSAPLTDYAGRYATPDMAFTLRVAHEHLLLTGEARPYPGLVSPAVQDALPTDAAVPVVTGDKLAIGWFLIGLRAYPKVSPG